MKSYKYLSISTGDSFERGGIWLQSTDSQVLNWIFAEVQKFYPYSQIKRRSELSSGEIYGVVIGKLDYEWSVHWWIVKQLCLQGWEPFAVGKEAHRYHLRLEVTDNGEDNKGGITDIESD